MPAVMQRQLLHVVSQKLHCEGDCAIDMMIQKTSSRYLSRNKVVYYKIVLQKIR